MTQAHFDDLTEINVPFGLLDGPTQDRLVSAFEAGQTIQRYNGTDWIGIGDMKARNQNESVLRMKPAPMMNFIEAIQYLNTNEGTKVKRKIWEDESYVSLSPLDDFTKTAFVQFNIGINCFVDAPAYLATDWIVV